MPRGKPCSLVLHDDVASLISDGLQVPQCSLRTGCAMTGRASRPVYGAPRPSHAGCKGSFLTGSALPLLPSHFSTAAQIQLLITLYVLPVVPLKHNIKSLGDLKKLPPPAITGKHPRLPTARIPKSQCLVPGKLLVRKLPSLAFMESTGYWNLTLQTNGSSCSMKLVRLHALICHAGHGPPAHPRLVAMHLCGDSSCIHPEHIAWKTQSGNILHACHKHTPMHIPTVALKQQARAVVRGRDAEMLAQQLEKAFEVTSVLMSETH